MTTDTKHLRALELLPWRSTDRLERDDFEYVQSAIEASAAVREEARQTDTLFAVLRDDVPVPMLTHERMRRVMARLEAEPQDARPFSLVVKRWWKQLRGSGKPFYLRTALPIALAASLAVVAVLNITPQSELDAGDYTTLYDARPTVPIEVRLADGVTPEAAQLIFDELALDATPQLDGSYRVRLPQNTSAGELYRVLQALRADGRVADAQALTEED